ncbi:SEFIR domain-containing protein [Maribacter sp. IgM3_T14_3]|uniref:SEFIR domain-containing protein n=1 Tax=Maribacter sp. IgM3_T14_3 TaxID=3415140 RepID=UPI003C70563D
MKVFVTYSWDSEEHKDNVLSLCDHLRQKGFNATIDRKISQEETAPDFTKMMHQAMTDYEKVIIVLSPGYKTKADSFTGGVGTEYSLIINDIVDYPNKYILVSLNGVKPEIKPLNFKGREILDLSNPAKENTLFAKLKDEEEIEFSPVAIKKPIVVKKVIKSFEERKKLAPIERNDYELRKKAITLFERAFQIISSYVSLLSGTPEFEDFSPTNTGYGLKENPLRKGHKYGLSNKYYSDVKCLPLNEIIVDEYQYVFKLDGEEYYRISVLEEIDNDNLEQKIKETLYNHLSKELLNK